MDEILAFLKENRPYYLATVDGDQARVRAMGTSNMFEGKLYFQTSREKDMYKQLKENPKVQICAFDGKVWMRVTAEAVEDEREEALADLLKDYPRLAAGHTPGDGKIVFYLDKVEAFFDSNSPDFEKKVIEL